MAETNDEKYLEDSGWVRLPGSKNWLPPFHSPHLLSCDLALTVQRALDAKEEREAWDRYAASPAAAQLVERTGAQLAEESAAVCKDFADAMLVERRKRFG